MFGKGVHHWDAFNCPWQYVSWVRKQRSKIDPDPWNSFESRLLWGKKWECVNHSWRHAWIVWLVHVLRFRTENSRQPSFGLNLWLYYWKILSFAANGSTKEWWCIRGQVIWANNISNPITPPILHSYLALIYQGLDVNLLSSAALTPSPPKK